MIYASNEKYELIGESDNFRLYMSNEGRYRITTLTGEPILWNIDQTWLHSMIGRLKEDLDQLEEVAMEPSHGDEDAYIEAFNRQFPMPDLPGLDIK